VRKAYVDSTLSRRSALLSYRGCVMSTVFAMGGTRKSRALQPSAAARFVDNRFLKSAVKDGARWNVPSRTATTGQLRAFGKAFRVISAAALFRWVSLIGSAEHSRVHKRNSDFNIASTARLSRRARRLRIRARSHEQQRGCDPRPVLCTHAARTNALRS
jgi:hypothetical protein